MRNLTVKPVSIDSQLKRSTQRIGFIPKGVMESNSLIKECATQTHVWKPGDYSLYLRAVGEFLPCTSSHRIKMNPLFVNLPYMDAFTLGVIEDQRLFPLMFRHDLETIETSKEIPRMHFFLPKLTRYKERRKLPYMDRFCTNLVQRLNTFIFFLRYLILNLVDMTTEEEADEYNISEVDWGEEPGYSWEDQNYGDGSEEEADEYNISEVDWGEEPGYSWEDQNYGDGSEEDDQCRESRAEDGYEEGPCRGEICPKRFVKLKPRQLHEREVTYNSYDQFRLYKFSGKGEDPRNYLQWEEDMERYFKCNSIPKGEYLSYGLGQLTEKAQRYWKREEKYREQFQEPPIRTWEQFKGVMRDRFAPYIPTQHAQKVSTKKVVQPQVLQLANQRQSSKPFDDLINLIKAGSNSVSSNSMNVLTHLSSAQKVKNISGTNMEIKEQEPNLAAQASSTLENSQVPTNDKVLSELNVINLNYQNTGMMHLYSVQNVYKGLGNEETRPEAQQLENNEQSILETSTPADHALEGNHRPTMERASSNIGSLKEGYPCNHEEFNRETSCYRFSTQPEHAANWFHTKRSNDLGDMPVTSQTIYTASELVLIKESNSLLKECTTQTHVWKPGDYSLYLRAVGEVLPCTSSHRIKMNPLFVNLPYMDAFTLGVIEDQRLFPLLFRHDLETIQTSKEIPRMHFFLPKLTRYKERRKLPYMDRFCTNLVQRLVFHLLFLSKLFF
ncbi:hypothetical protein IGI04_035726 [Brassica rapa subsp. trilocularis]|uniref:Uncharacterized protein n=1 Tax=Brassica rapa subsp. trilocularis TaxID=1813537 RepID=A0ABQ7LCE9_BRACM|nr:hypothetical protein IGI04_035726 [Brassica rapa subsp. trilocularis]